jgi:hypothetical protein
MIDTDCSSNGAVLDADKVRVPGEPGATEREAGESITPSGSPPMLTDTFPVNPFRDVTEICTG